TATTTNGVNEATAGGRAGAPAPGPARVRPRGKARGVCGAAGGGREGTSGAERGPPSRQQKRHICHGVQATRLRSSHPATPGGGKWLRTRDLNGRPRLRSLHAACFSRGRPREASE